MADDNDNDDKPKPELTLDIRGELILLDPEPTSMNTEAVSTAAYCKHLSVQADFEERTLVCRNCGAKVDEYYWIDRVIREWSDIRRHISMLKRQRDELDDEVKALKAMRSGLNQALKRGQKRISEPS